MFDLGEQQYLITDDRSGDVERIHLHLSGLHD